MSSSSETADTERDRIRRLEREVRQLRDLVHASPSARAAAERTSRERVRFGKTIRKLRKRLLLAAHPDKTQGLRAKELSELFTRTVTDSFREVVA